MNIAIYDLDKTITRRPTFTHFLLYYAQRERPYRLVGVPVWIAALIGYRLGLYGRKPLKQFGIALFMGRVMQPQILHRIVANFVDDVVMNDLQSGAVDAIENDRVNNRKLVMATAAPEFYATEIGARLGFDAVIATRHIIAPGGMICNTIDGDNCYGSEKRRRIETWMAEQGIARDQVHIRFYTDDISDTPTLNLADKGYAVNPGDAFAKAAEQSGWTILNFRDRLGNFALN